MKKCFVLWWALIIPCYLFSQNVDYPEFTFPCGDYQWELVWSDEFNDGVIDESKWETFGTYAIDGINDLIDYAYIPSFASESNGCMNLKTDKLSPPLTYLVRYDSIEDHLTAHTFDYGSGRIFTYGKNEWLYGRFEARIKIAGGYGLWPAYWLFGGYPYWNEIDIFEFFPNYKSPINIWGKKCVHETQNENWQDRILSSNIRVDWINQNGTIDVSGDNAFYSEDYSISYKYNTHFSEDFHIYTLEWDPYKIVWKLDGQAIREYYHYQSFSGYSITGCDLPTIATSLIRGLFANYPMELYFNTAIWQANLEQGDDIGYNCMCPDQGPNGCTLPSYMNIDYLRIYKRSYCGENIYISSKKYKQYETEYIPANNIDVAGNNNIVLLDTFSNVSYIAGNSIRLHYGFRAIQGCHFSASIRPCTNYKSSEIDFSELPIEKYNAVEKNDSSDLIEQIHFDEFSVYPNPSNGCFTLVFNSENLSLEFFDENGKGIPYDFRDGTLCCSAAEGKYYLRFFLEGQLHVVPIFINY
ncbi:MAG: hypothetical protein CVU11_16695 [Bacteroidetes bacterium HGW-Bacteroidetes-6]|jgi:hypothetical protein|nr:MAG: hypothetical protein CVU11_16695 [Bacteroidetes bacterium HGW-Bacteroidetes-6]